MTAIGIWLAAIGVADLVFAPSGRPTRRVEVPGALSAAVVSFFSALLFGLSLLEAVVLTVASAAATWGWIRARVAAGWSPARAAYALSACAAVFFVMIVTASLWDEARTGPVVQWLARTPFPALQETAAARAALIVGATLVLCGTANAVVRLVLEAAETLPRERNRPPLSGGRVVGILERLLIFGFIVAGAPAAAALVASAKSVLRFPEISRSGTEIHVATEYFLVGSLTSWLLAAGFAAFVAT